MSDYIKREDALDMHFSMGLQDGLTLYVRYAEVKDNIKHIPAADVAKVVRCKDCKYRNDDNGNCYVSNFITGLPCMIRYVGEDDYCSYGKHKGARA